MIKKEFQFKLIYSNWERFKGNSKLKRIIWAFIGGFILIFGARMAGGCTSGHILSGGMQLAISRFGFLLFLPLSDSWLQENFFTQKNNYQGTDYMYRVGSAVGAVIKSQVKINGKEAGALINKSFFEWELEPGKYIFTSYTKESNPVIEIDVKPNQKYYIRQDKKIGLTNEGRVTLKLVSEATGTSKVSKLKKEISNYVD